MADENTSAHHPHDGFFKYLMQHRDTAIAFLEDQNKATFSFLFQFIESILLTCRRKFSGRKSPNIQYKQFQSHPNTATFLST